MGKIICKNGWKLVLPYNTYNKNSTRGSNVNFLKGIQIRINNCCLLLNEITGRKYYKMFMSSDYSNGLQMFKYILYINLETWIKYYYRCLHYYLLL